MRLIGIFIAIILLLPLPAWAQDSEAVLNALNQLLNRMGKIERRLDRLERHPKIDSERGRTREETTHFRSEKKYQRTKKYRHGWVVDVIPSNSDDSIGAFISKEVSPVSISNNGRVVSGNVRINLSGKGIFVARNAGKYTFLCKLSQKEDGESSWMRNSRFRLTIEGKPLCNMRKFYKAREYLVAGGVDLSKGEYVISFSTKMGNGWQWSYQKNSRIYLYVREPGALRPRLLTPNDILHVAR